MLGSAALEAEGLFCQSVRFSVQVDEIENINAQGVSEPLYFEF